MTQIGSTWPIVEEQGTNDVCEKKNENLYCIKDPEITFPVQVRKASNELGLPQTPIESGIMDAVEWFRGNGYVQS